MVSLLRTLHDELDAAVLQAYGWNDLGQMPWGNASAQQAWTDALLTRLVALNVQRALEEQQGTIHWLRPAFQDPVLRQQQAEMLLNVELLALTNKRLEANLSYKRSENPAQTGQDVIHATRSDNRDISDKNATHGKTDSRSPPQPWPATLPEQVKVVAHLLASAPEPLTLVQIEATFSGRGGWKKALPILLETLVALGRAQQLDTDGMTTWGNV